MLLRSFYRLAPGFSRGEPYLLHITPSTRLTVVMEPAARYYTFKAAGLFPFLSPEHHNYPNYYHHRNPRSPYDIDRSPVWYVQKLCHHYCEPANHPPRFALSLHGVRRVGRFNALALLKVKRRL
jgi:hypothetical protein